MYGAILSSERDLLTDPKGYHILREDMLEEAFKRWAENFGRQDTVKWS